jgi:hypothetical protein
MDLCTQCSFAAPDCRRVSPNSYRGQVLLPPLLGNERLIWSVARVNPKLEHPQAGLVCLTQRCSHSGNYIVVPCIYNRRRRVTKRTYVV